MQLAMIGLGRMGMNMTRRLLGGGHVVVAFNRTRDKTDQLLGEGALGAYSLPEVVEKLTPPRVVWLMLPAGEIIDEHIDQLKELLDPGDIVIDGANTYYKDDIQRSGILAERSVEYLDVGVSGGIWGLKIGYCLMIGGKERVFRSIESVLQTLAPKDGYLYCGGPGAGHFVKMVHNGIEYGMMQAYGEGFQLLEASPYAESLNFAEVAHLWNQGSVVRSWLLELAEDAFRQDPALTGITGFVEDSGEGRWTVQQAVESSVSIPVIALSLFQRFRSRQKDPFADRVLAALRREFGGHSVVQTGTEPGE
ncbi:MAG: phosphogluconate dehydrogenase (NAD(+)-dependent, decarboxylating) [Syntrophobacteraceae bacterium]